MKVYVDFELLTYWHAGTGRGAGPDLDAVVARTPAGLPYLPGRTVKGLLRDAMELAVACDTQKSRQAVDHWLGTALRPVKPDRREREIEEQRFSTKPGRLRVSSAEMVDDDHRTDTWEAWARAHPARVEHLFSSFASTKLEGGTAADKTLRAVEVAVPMKLRAAVECDDATDATWIALLKEAAPLLRALGSHRNRGLGRVRVSVKDAPSEVRR
jgi:CRISPR/Cas system CSM-associated protein Csm3 (group 7 of RAMP superfamily)